jgi:hypothetical protein
MVFAGGIPLTRDGRVVSGGSGEQDHAVAEAGAKAFQIFKGANYYGKQSWSSVRWAGKS